MVSVFQCSACADNAFGTMAEIRSRKVSDFGYSRHNRNGSFFTPGDLASVQPDRISRNVGRQCVLNPETYDLTIHELAAKASGSRS